MEIILSDTVAHDIVMSGFCEHGNELSTYIKDGKFFG